MARYIDDTGEYVNDNECVICHVDMNNSAASLCSVCEEELEAQANAIGSEETEQ